MTLPRLGITVPKRVSADTPVVVSFGIGNYYGNKKILRQGTGE